GCVRPGRRRSAPWRWGRTGSGCGVCSSPAAIRRAAGTSGRQSGASSLRRSAGTSPTGLPYEESRGLAQDLAFLAQLLVLAAQAGQLGLVVAGGAFLLAGVDPGLFDPGTDGLGRGLELGGQVLGCASGLGQG